LANNSSAKKRIRQNEKAKARNGRIKSSVRTIAKKLRSLFESKEAATGTEAALRKFEKTVDGAARKGVLHWKTAARYKSRMAKKANSKKIAG